MNGSARLVLNIVTSLILVLLPGLGFATTQYIVNAATDTGEGSGNTGDLRYVINQLNSSGTPGPAVGNNSITIEIDSEFLEPIDATIYLSASLPVIQNGVSITSGNSTTTTIYGYDSYGLFATYGASLSLSNVVLENGLAAGGAGANGGGGGLGAGGGIYIDLGQTLTIGNITIQNCSAVGGAGGAGTSGTTADSGGGGGASFTVGLSSLNNNSANAYETTGGGDFPGGYQIGGGSSRGTSGYGGGSGASGNDGGVYTGGAGGGDGAGSPTTPYGGAGGYCGGGGGGSTSNGAGSGAGGGNPGGSSGAYNLGGGGGGFGSGGGGGEDGSAGGGGGFAGGGGGGSTGGSFSTGGSGSGGGGGGFGGGGGGSGATAGAGGGPYAGGSGGSYGGTGGIGNTSPAGGGGGGGGALGGAIFVGDSATLNVGDGISIAAAANFVTGGAAGAGGAATATPGKAYATDIFLFRGAQLSFNGANDATIPFAIQADVANSYAGNPGATAGNLDAGIQVNLTNTASTITLSSTSNNYQGGTVITSGGLTANLSNLPTIGNISTATNGTFTLTGGGTIINTITNAGTFNISDATSTTAPINNTGNINISAAFTNNSTITSSSGTVDITAAFTNNGTFTNGGTLDITEAFTNSNSATLTNSGTMSLESTSSFTSDGIFTNSGILNINDLSFTPPTVFNNTGTTNLNGTASNIVGNFVGGTGAALTVGNTSESSYSTTGNISAITTLSTIASGTVFTINNTVTGNSNSTFYIGPNTTVSLTSGASVNDFSSIVIDGTYNIANGATYTLNADNNLSGSGTISNQGLFYMNGNINFSGSFANEASGVTTINGTPTLTFSGTSFTNLGNLVVGFNSSNDLPTINATNVTNPDNLNLSSGVIIISYTNDYIASGTYPLLNAGTPPQAGAAILPQNTFYISNWQLKTIGDSLVVEVTRDGFGDHALTAEAVAIGDFLEEIGASNPNASQLVLLNALEEIQNDEELTVALLSLLPPQYNYLVTLNMQDEIIGALDIRLATSRGTYSSGEEINNDKLGVWIRPFGTKGTQTPKGILNGYTNKNHGWIFGFDRSISTWLTLGIAGSYTKSSVNDTTQAFTTTNINTYQVMFYSTLRGPKDSYVDALISGGVSNYHGVRTVSFPGFTQSPSSNYTSQQITLKVRGSKIFNWNDFWQFTPNAIAQYSFVRTLSYTENSAGSYDVFVNPNNINLFRLGVGASLGIPFKSNEMISIPSVYAMAFYDVAGGAVTTNSQFISGGPIISNTVQQSTGLLKFGAMYELMINENLQFVANYDYLVRHNFKGTEALLNIRYIF